MPLMYLDSSILVSWILPNDRRHARALEVISSIKNGQVIGVISSLGILETIDVIRKRVAQNYPYTEPSDKMDLTPIKDAINKKIEEFLDGITILASKSQIIWNDPSLNMDKIFDEAFAVQRGSFGTIRHATNCIGCEKSLDENKYYYFGAGQYDVQHAIIAKSLKVNMLRTFDGGFKYLIGLENFKGLSIVIN